MDDVIFYPTYAFFTRALPDQPHRAQDWSFRGGFSTIAGTGRARARHRHRRPRDPRRRPSRRGARFRGGPGRASDGARGTRLRTPGSARRRPRLGPLPGSRGTHGHDRHTNGRHRRGRLAGRGTVTVSNRLPGRTPTRIRARDVDRTAVRAALDAAFTDGQLSHVEHRRRNGGGTVGAHARRPRPARRRPAGTAGPERRHRVDVGVDVDEHTLGSRAVGRGWS